MTTVSEENCEAFTRNLRAAMAALHMSQADLSRASGVSKDRISHYCNGSMPRRNNLKRIAKALDTTPGTLLGTSTSAFDPRRDAWRVIMVNSPLDGHVRLEVSAHLPRPVAELIEQLAKDCAVPPVE